MPNHPLLDAELSADDVRWLIDALQKDGHVPAVSAALELWRCDRELGNPPLTVEHKTAILGVLDDPPDGNLTELRAVLLKQQEWRAREGLSA